MPITQKCVALDCESIDDITGLCFQCRIGFALGTDGRCAIVKNYGICPDRKYLGSRFVC